MNNSVKTFIKFLLLSFIIISFSVVCYASTATFQQGTSGYSGTNDLSISDQYATSNGGKGQTTTTGAYTVVRNSSTGNYKYEGLLKFDNLTLPVGARITGATITLKISSWNPGTTIKGYYLNTAWNSSFSDFGWTKKDSSSLWAVPGARGDGQDTVSGKGFTLSGITGSGVQTLTIDLDKDVVAGWVANPTSNYGLLMYVDPSIANGQVSIYSADSTTVTDRPKLTISYDTGDTDVVPPVISAISITNISTSSAKVSWATDESSDALVEYGNTSNYGSFSAQDTNLVIGHNATLENLDPGAVYHFRVKSKDLSGNPSVSSDNIFTTDNLPVVVIDPTPMPVINSFSATPSTITSGDSALLSWDQSDGTSLSIDQGIGNVSGTSVSVTPTATTTYTLTVSNTKGSVNKSVTIGVIPVVGSDATSPSAPKNLLIYKKTTFEAVMSWDASTDNVGVVGYNIYRFGIKIGSSISPTYTDSNLESGIAYGYSVTAVDAMGNESDKSNMVYIVMPLFSSASRGDGVCQPTLSLPATTVQNVNIVKQILPSLLADADTYDALIAPYRNSTDKAVKDAVNMVDLSIKLLRTVPLALTCNPQDFGYTILPSRLQSVQQALPYFYAKAQSGQDPYAGMKKGTIAVKSNIDNNIDYYYFALPSSYNPATKYRLRVVLHFAGSCMWEAAGIGTFAPVAGDLLVGQPSASSPLGSISDSVYIVPCGRGASHSYAGIAQKNVLDEIADASSRFSIDPNLITISGSSMGGTGSVDISTHYPDMFSSIGILTGSPDFNLPTGDYRYDGSMLYNNVGSINYVLWNTPGDTSSYQKEENFANNLQTLGTAHPGYYPYRKYTDPAGSHGIINPSLIAQGDTFLNLGVRNKYPARVNYVTGSEQYDGSYWVHNMTRPNVLLPGSIEAEFSSDKTNINVTTSNLKSFSFDLSSGNPLVAGLSNISVSVNGQSMPVPVGSIAYFNNIAGSWVYSSSTPSLVGIKHKGVSGPIVDVFMDKPVLMVYGTKQGNTSMRGKAMVDELTQVYFGSSVAGDSYMHYGNFEIKADTDVTQDDIQNKNLVLFGTPNQNSLVAQISSQVPIQFLSNGVTLGGKSYTGTKIGWSVVYPNPLNQSNYVLLVSEDYNMGLIGFINAPVLQNDYVVAQGYDTGLYRRKVLGKGLFDYQWK